MADVDLAEHEKGYNSGSSENESLHVFERPTGIKGLYYHPLTQVSYFREFNFNLY